MRELIDFGREFVLSFNPSAAEAAEVVRGHWMIESLHWGLDRAFREDACKVKEHALVANMSSLKKLAAALLKRMTFTRPNRGKRLKSTVAQLSVPARQRASRSSSRYASKSSSHMRYT